MISRLGLVDRQLLRRLSTTKGRVGIRCCKRHASDVADSATQSEDVEKTTGVIETKTRQGLLYYDNVFPSFARFSVMEKVLELSPWFNKSQVIKRLQTVSFPSEVPVEIVQLIPRERDGGAFVTYQVNDNSTSLDDAEAIVEKKLTDAKYRPWFSPLRPMRVFKVKGTPWIEDLRRYTTNNIRVSFDGPDVSQETLYSLLRRYGPIIDIIPPAPGTKDLPRSALVVFIRFRDAATARNCITGLMVGTTKVHLSFEPFDHKNVIKDWVVNHPRLVIPIVFALLATLAVLIFEPIRVWSIQRKIHGSSSFENISVVKWVRKLSNTAWDSINHYMGSRRDNDVESDLLHLWEERVNSIDSLKQWIEEGAGTFIIVSGPRGGGKHDMVMNHVLKKRSDVVSVDCAKLVKSSRGDAAFVKAAAKELGYFPVFPWKNTIANFLDVIAQGLSGQKTGFAESAESQFKNMLVSASAAVHKTALEGRKSDEIDENNYLQLHPEKKPVIVIDHFMARTESNQFVYPQVADWAAGLIQANVAHVIFISSDVGYDKVLSQALPNSVFKDIVVGDATEASARHFVLRQLSDTDDGTDSDQEKTTTSKPTVDIQELNQCLAPLGGRMTDLQAFARRLKSGETPDESLGDMIDQSSVEIVQMFLMRQNPDWTREQAWVLVKKLAALAPLDELTFGEIVQDPHFKTRDQQKALVMLENNEMISTRTVGGRILSIRPGKPLYHAAFRHLVKDTTLNALMESQLIANAISKEEANISKIEEELATLSKLSNRWEIKPRSDYLSSKLYGSQQRIVELEKTNAVFQKILAGQPKPRR
jgi:hypothetical protein